MKMKRIISTVLAVLMLISAFTVAMFAEEATGETTDTTEKITDSSKPTIDYFTGQSVEGKKNSKGEYEYVATGTKVIYSAEDKLAYMDLRFEKDGYQLYVDEYSGEVATRCVATGEILFSNPYTVGESSATDSIKTQLMSQLVVKYVDISTGDDNTYYSFEWASQRNQVKVRNIKNGIRIEYTIGREEARMLVPRLIEKSAFETKILNVMSAAVGDDSHANFLFSKLKAYYTLQDPDAQTSSTLLDEMQKAFPITKKMAVYVLDSSTSQTEMANIEQLIKTYCPDYTYEELDDDHMLTEYESEDKNPPLFKMALEYTLDEHGMSVSLPANGIRFNESLYQLYSVEILPYMGAGANSNTVSNFSENNSGYTFFPDGSGTLFDFEKITDLGASTTVTGKVYGQDYAYHTISGTHQEIIRYPVFGIVETEDLTALQTTVNEEGKKVANTTPADERDYKSRGFVAIVEEGDALMELSSYHAVRTSEYNTVRMIVYPRPQDTYNVADSISVGSNDTWTVVTERKYTGNYTVRYIMLTDTEVAQENDISDYYECTYVGMARAYREYLEDQEVLTQLEDDDVSEDIPLYIEAFGALETTERFLSIPLDVMTPLTTFEDIQTMRDDLAEKGIENINFVLTGFTKGGLTDRQAPYYLSWDGAVDDELDFDELLAYAKDKDFGIYPDFDFAYVMGDGWFDGVSLKKHAVKTIDDRYTSKREYSATKQTYVSYFELAISPAYYTHFYEHLTEEYLEYDPIGISVSTLGSALNSDFDEDEPYNREDSKNYTIAALEHFAENYDKVLTSGGNAYSWQYVDYITDVALDSSRYSQSSASVPFLGMVLHGYVEIAGTAINMEGNIDYAVLKAIENGASLKFILSYRNTNNLKNYEDLSQYYSVRYDIWFDDVVELYNEINDALSGVQTSLITEHKFIEGVRVPDDDELLANAANTIDEALQNELDYEDALTQAEKDAYRKARQEIKNIVSTLTTEVDSDLSEYNMQLSDYQAKLGNIIGEKDTSLKKIFDSYLGTGETDEQLDGLESKVGSAKAKLDTYTDEQKASDEYKEAEEAYNTALAKYTAAAGTIGAAKRALDKLTEGAEGYADAKKAYEDQVAEFQTAAAECIFYFSDLTTSATSFADKIVDLYDSYKLATTDYLELVNADPNLTKAQKDAINKEVKDLVEKIGTMTDYVLNDVTKAIEQINKDIAEAHALMEDQYARIQGEGKLFAADTFTLPETFEYEIEVSEPEVKEDNYKKVENPVYSSDDNKIVYEVYENGTSFLLNFNNYQVMVELNGNVYTIDAYGYIILSRGN